MESFFLKIKIYLSIYYNSLMAAGKTNSLLDISFIRTPDHVREMLLSEVPLSGRKGKINL